MNFICVIFRITCLDFFFLVCLLFKTEFFSSFGDCSGTHSVARAGLKPTEIRLPSSGIKGYIS